MSLSNRAMLVTLSCSMPEFRKQDKRATSTVETSHQTDGHVGAYTKKLLPGAIELQNVRTIVSRIRDFVKYQTSPWMQDGTRIIASQNYMPFVQDFRKLKQDFDSAVALFLREYPYLKETAKMRLGDLYREADYPTVDRLEALFNCEISFMPMPDVSDFRVSISDEEKSDFEKKMQQVQHVAMQDTWQRLYDVVSKAANVLSKPDAIFRDSLIENISEICAFLPRLNIADDPKLEQMRQDVEKLASQISPDVCRDNASERDNNAKKLSEICDAMSAFMAN